MAIKVETVHSYLETLAYQMKVGLDQDNLGGPIALTKSYATKVLSFCVNEASQIFGGASYIQGVIFIFLFYNTGTRRKG
jgi:acyl-CoA dehydrogenase